MQSMLEGSEGNEGKDVRSRARQGKVTAFCSKGDALLTENQPLLWL